MLKIFRLMMTMLIIAAAGCARTIEVDGESYTMLNDRETTRLIELTRATMKRQLDKKVISQAEYDTIRTTEPNIRTRYRGDKYGNMEIFWRTRMRFIGMMYREDLTVQCPACALIIQNIPPEERDVVMPDRSIRGR